MDTSTIIILVIVLLLLLAIVAGAVYGFVKAFFKYGGEFRKNKQGFVIVFFPWFMYSIFSVLAGVLNVVFNDLLAQRAKVAPTRWSDKAHAPEAIKSIGEKRIEEMKKLILEQQPELFPENELVQLFDSLEPAHEDDLLHKTFKSKIVDVEGLALDNFYEKVVKLLAKVGAHVHRRFINKFEGDSLCLNVLDLVIFPLPLFGNVGVKELSFRGKVQATICYDHQPWQDYVRILDDNAETGKKTLLVMTTCRDQGLGFYQMTFRPEIDTN